LPNSHDDDEQKSKAVNKPAPAFKMHVPTNGKVQAEEKKEDKKLIREEDSWLKFGVEEKDVVKKETATAPPPPPAPPVDLSFWKQKKTEYPKKPEIKTQPILRKPDLPTPPIVSRPKEAPLPPRPAFPKAMVEKPKVEDHTLRMRVPEAEGILDNKGKKVISETADKIEEIQKPHPITDYFRKEIGLDKFKKPAEFAELNLMSEDYNQIVATQFWLRLRVLFLVALLFVIIFAIAFIGIKLYGLDLSANIKDKAARIESTTAEIGSYNSGYEKYANLQTRALRVMGLLDSQVYWTNLFSKLEEYTVTNVYYNTLAIEGGSNIVLDARALSYDDVAKQIFVFENADFVSAVDVNSIIRESVKEAGNGGQETKGNVANELHFKIKLAIKPEVLFQYGK